jgi:mono/diheme cytochrome c family protein
VALYSCLKGLGGYFSILGGGIVYDRVVRMKTMRRRWVSWRQMVRVLWGALSVVLLLGVGLWISGLVPHCCGARQAPSQPETALARFFRSLSLPSGASQNKNPFALSPELLQEASRHFADHCASCHGNDGGGNTEMGRNLYPPAPDLRLGATQKLSDGELYYIIHNGVRWTGMPAWGEPGEDAGSWKLVWFVRHLPHLTADELHDMERFNPHSAAEREEEKQEEDFLNGGTAGDPAPKHR